MSARKAHRSPKAPGPTGGPRIARALDLVFKASGIVDCCVYASDSLLVRKNGRPNMQSALEGAHDLLSQAAVELDEVSQALRKGGAS